MATPPYRSSEPKDEVTLSMNGNDLIGWSDIEIAHTIDSITTVNFGAPFEAASELYRSSFRPFKYQPMEVLIDDEREFLGRALAPTPTFDANESLVGVSGYSLPGPLMDCGVGGKYYPLEFNNFKLQAVARALAKPFGVEVRFDAGDSAVFGKSKLDIGQTVFDFLSNLAMQRGTLISNTKDGELYLYNSTDAGNPMETIDGSLNPSVVVTPWFNGQGWFSEITGFARTKKGRIGTSHTVLNPHAGDVYRPFIFEVQDTEAADVPAATEACLARMLGGAMGVTVDVAGWRTSAGELWEVNKTVMLVAQDAMIYSAYEFLIAGVVRRQNANKLTTSLALVLPGAYTGQIPSTLPWSEPSSIGGLG